MKTIKTVVLAGALDTKGREYAFVKNLIEKQGFRTLVVDFGVMGEPGLELDIGRAEVAKAGGGDIEEMRGYLHCCQSDAGLAANAATGPVSIVIPLRTPLGVSMLDSSGGDFWDPEADHVWACFDAIKETLKPSIPLIELDNNINDPNRIRR